MIAALYVEKNGVYYGLDDVDPWDQERDARKYAGPWPVVAHPPCARWGRYWFGGPSARERLKMGDDSGCFAAAVESVRQWGGVLEHPEATHAFAAFGIGRPDRRGWTRCLDGGYICEVEQGHYGHRARKKTWLYVQSPRRPPDLLWGPSPKTIRFDDGFHSAEERRAFRSNRTLTPEMRAKKSAWMDSLEAKDLKFFRRLTKSELSRTPIPFRDTLLAIARTASRDVSRTT